MELGLIVHKIAENVANEIKDKDQISTTDIIAALKKHTPQTTFDLTKHIESLLDFFSTILI